MSDSLGRFTKVMEAAVAALEERREEINDLNVFPVADGDTGDNMLLTVRAVTEELARLDDEVSAGDLDDVGRTEIVEAVARAALLGARGNSGVILSQLIRGAAEELISRHGKPVDPQLLASAMLKAAGQARGSVRDPQEGTILTVIDDMARGLGSAIAEGAAGPLPDNVDATTQDTALADALAVAVVAGEASVARGPELLDVLRESGVVDAGGYGLLVIFAAVLACLRGEPTPELAHQNAPTGRKVSTNHASSSFQYCVNFAVSGTGLDAGMLTGELEAIGDSVLVVGDSSTIRVHIHTDDAEQATALFEGQGTVSRLEVADMINQVRERQERLDTSTQVRSLVLAVVVGPEIRGLFEAEGARVIECDKTLNPSTSELIDAIEAVPAEQVVLLTGSSNVVMAAEEAARMASKPVAVVPTATVQEGLFVLVSHQHDRDASENATEITEALAGVRTAGVAEASVADKAGRFNAGDAIGFIEGELVLWGTPEDVMVQLAELLSDAELLLAIHSDDAPLTVDQLRRAIESFEQVEIHRGTHAGWWLLLAVE